MARRKRFAAAPPIDTAQIAEAATRPGADPRQWVSFGTVDGATEDDPEPEVTFDEDYGTPIVKVTLQPSQVQVVCRVAMQISGNGEGEWHPFVKGDEVLVAIPGGDEREGCVIIGRLNNAVDPFPMESVAGQDPTTNTFGFRRCRTPRIEEYAGSFMLRSAMTGAMMGFDEGGAFTLRDAESNGLQLSPDAISLMSGQADMMLQLDLAGRHALVQAGDAILSLSASDASPSVNTLTTPGALTIGAGGNAPGEHVVSIEAVANVLYQVLLVVGPLLTTPIAAPAVPAALAGMLSAAAKTPINQVVLAAIVGAIVTQPQKTVAPPTGQLTPGIGCPGLLVG